MPTVVISDLHLGGRGGHAVLERKRPLEALIAALQDVDRLVLLGDVVELIGRRNRDAMAVAQPVLRALGHAVGPSGEVILVPGNHDRALVSAWVRRQGSKLAIDSRVPPADAGAALSTLSGWLAPARVRVHYPGVWLADGVWATHGHYLNRYLFPRSSIGIRRGLLWRAPERAARPSDYERRRVGVTPPRGAIEALPAPLDHLADDLLQVLRATTMPVGPRDILHPRFSQITSRLLSLQMRFAAIPALARVVQRLHVEADTVIFGHVHRLGPIEGDRAAQWTGPGGTPRIWNTGSWLFEPLLVERVTAPHPYWPGGAVILDSGAPRAIGLLDAVEASALTVGAVS